MYGTKEARPVEAFVGQNHTQRIIFFQAEYLAIYMHILFFSSGYVFYLTISMLLCFLLTESHYFMSMAKLGTFLSYKYYIYFSIELVLFVYLGVCYS